VIGERKGGCGVWMMIGLYHCVLVLRVFMLSMCALCVCSCAFFVCVLCVCVVVFVYRWWGGVVLGLAP
jgi:hypothetical protein